MAFETGSLRTDVLNISIRQAQMTEVPVKSLKKNFTGLPGSDVTPENSLDTYNRIATTDRKDPMGKILSWFDHYRKLGALLNYETKKRLHKQSAEALHFFKFRLLHRHHDQIRFRNIGRRQIELVLGPGYLFFDGLRIFGTKFIN